MPWFEKKFNKAIIWLIIGTTIAGMWVVAWAKTEKGKKIVAQTKTKTSSLLKRLVNFLYGGLQEMKNKMDKTEEDPK